jgi:hypothetical protein
MFAIGIIASILNFIALRHFEKSQAAADKKSAHIRKNNGNRSAI